MEEKCNSHEQSEGEFSPKSAFPLCYTLFKPTVTTPIDLTAFFLAQVWHYSYCHRGLLEP